MSSSLNDVQHIFPGGVKNFLGVILPPLGYGPGFNIAIHIRIHCHFSVFFLSVASDPLQWLVDLFRRVAEPEVKYPIPTFPKFSNPTP